MPLTKPQRVNDPIRKAVSDSTLSPPLALRDETYKQSPSYQENEEVPLHRPNTVKEDLVTIY